MITVPELTAEALSSFLASEMKRMFESSHARLTELVPSAARLALECIGNSDAFYHNVTYTAALTSPYPRPTAIIWFLKLLADPAIDTFVGIRYNPRRAHRA